MKVNSPAIIKDRINVVKTYLPPLEDYVGYLQQIWERNWVTNNGPVSEALQERLEDYLNVPHLQYVTNGTVALQLAIKSLDLTGEIITTPYSYVATTNSIIWENCTPVFVDIDPVSLCIDVNLIADKITSKTSAILATHVYGIPCDVTAIDHIAEKHNLKVVYDGAHAFGVKIKGQSIFNYGTLSTVSFHATKVFHTIEGGAMITTDPQLNEKLFLLKTFGHRMDDYQMVGINGKNSELHAAIGLCNLNTVDYMIKERKTVFELYKSLLINLPLTTLQIGEDNTHNYAYFPVVFEHFEKMNEVKIALEQQNIFPRRYFYPSLNKLPYVVKVDCPTSERISSSVLCLPFYHDISEEDIRRIVKTIKSCY